MNVHVPRSERERAEWEAMIRGKKFLGYQARWIADKARLAMAEKSRQVGLSWADAYDSMRETAMQGWRFDCWITSRDQVQAQLYAQDAVYWAKAFNIAAGELGEAVIETETGAKVSATRLQFANARSIYSLSSNVDAQAGKRGTRKLDEFALNRENRRLYAIAYPGLTWGGRLRIFSTHRGSQNFFNELIEEAKHKGNPKKISLHRITLADALQDGLLVKLKDAWRAGNPEDERLGLDEDEYLQYTRNQCPDEETFQEEFMCVPSSDESAFLTYDLLTPCFYQGGDVWETDLRQAKDLYVGVDIGRDHDLTVIWVMEKVNGVYFTRRVIELANQTFAAQRNTLYPILALPNVRRCCIDATGIGRQLAEEARMQFGSKVEEVKFTNEVKAELAYPFRAAFEDVAIRIPNDRKITADLRAVKKTTTSAGNIRFDADRGKNGHSDRFWAAALAVHSGATGADVGEFRRLRSAQAQSARNLDRAARVERRRRGSVFG